eukprot:849648-Alexandrium_andersonii.AAC.1
MIALAVSGASGLVVGAFWRGGAEETPKRAPKRPKLPTVAVGGLKSRLARVAAVSSHQCGRPKE